MGLIKHQDSVLAADVEEFYVVSEVLETCRSSR
jgi:hypothetical protein